MIEVMQKGGRPPPKAEPISATKEGGRDIWWWYNTMIIPLWVNIFISALAVLQHASARV